MPALLQLTLQQLSQVALGGGSKVGEINLQALQSLLTILLKRLNCENEIISISGKEAKCVSLILEKSQDSPLQFCDDNEQMLKNKFEYLEKLEEKASKLQANWDFHLSKLKELEGIVEPASYLELFWNNPNIKEHLPNVVCNIEDQAAFAFIVDKDMLKAVAYRLFQPITDRIFQFEKKIESFQVDFNRLFEELKTFNKDCGLLLETRHQFHKIEELLSNHQLTVLGCMEEVQDILDYKVDKLLIPALKKNIKDSFDEIFHDIYVLTHKPECPYSQGLIDEGLICVCCGDTRIGADVGQPPTAMMNNIFSKRILHFKHCSKQPCNDNQEGKRLEWSSFSVEFNGPISSQAERRREKPQSVEQCLQKRSNKSRQAAESTKKKKFDIQTGTGGYFYRID